MVGRGFKLHGEPVSVGRGGGPLCWQDKYNNGLRKVGALQTLYNAVRECGK